MQELFWGFFKNKNGDIIIWQSPNLLLYLWGLLKIITFTLANTQLKNGLRYTASAVLFSWAYLEITKGQSNFRKSLGVIVLLATVGGYFTK